MLLRLEDAVSGYGSGEVLHGVTLSVEHGEMVSLIGPNGAGKSTIFRTISGLLRLRRGRRFLAEEDISALPAHAVAKLGLAQSFEHLRDRHAGLLLDELVGVEELVSEALGESPAYCGLPHRHEAGEHDVLHARAPMTRLTFSMYAW